MFTQVITPVKKPVIIDIPDEYLGHRLNITVSELADEERTADDENQYSFENALKFWRAHRVDLSNFKFDREEANER
jgi:hypothetical protein